MCISSETKTPSNYADATRGLYLTLENICGKIIALPETSHSKSFITVVCNIYEPFSLRMKQTETALSFVGMSRLISGTEI